VRELLRRVLGRASLPLDALRPAPLLPADGPTESPAAAGRLDGTGLVAADDDSLPVLWDDDEVLFVGWPSLAHSFWRAQELSLFRAQRPLFAPPVLDFGCGDGSFAAALGGRFAFGADHDARAVARARALGVFEQVLACDERSIPLPGESARTVISNSVLEHVRDLDAVLAELRRVLAPEGRLLFTVPVRTYHEHLVRYFGRPAADAVQVESAHHNLLDAEAWRDRLADHGFEVVSLRPFQPPAFTWTYRMLRLLGPRGLGRWISRELAWRILGPSLVAQVRRSILSRESGANVFFVARRADASRAT
jgi:SAM-dependent methyltransferase